MRMKDEGGRQQCLQVQEFNTDAHLLEPASQISYHHSCLNLIILIYLIISISILICIFSISRDRNQLISETEQYIHRKYDMLPIEARFYTSSLPKLVTNSWNRMTDTIISSFETQKSDILAKFHQFINQTIQLSHHQVNLLRKQTQTYLSKFHVKALDSNHVKALDSNHVKALDLNHPNTLMSNQVEQIMSKQFLIPKIVWLYSASTATTKSLLQQKNFQNIVKYTKQSGFTCIVVNKNTIMKHLSEQNLEEYKNTIKILEESNNLDVKAKVSIYRDLGCLYLLKQSGGVFVEESVILTQNLNWLSEIGRKDKEVESGEVLAFRLNSDKMKLHSFWMAAKPSTRYIIQLLQQYEQILLVHQLREYRSTLTIAEDETSKQATDQTSNQATDQTSNQATDQTSNQATDQTSNQATGQTSNQATGQTSNQATSANHALGFFANASALLAIFNYQSIQRQIYSQESISLFEPEKPDFTAITYSRHHYGLITMEYAGFDSKITAIREFQLLSQFTKDKIEKQSANHLALYHIQHFPEFNTFIDQILLNQRSKIHEKSFLGEFVFVEENQALLLADSAVKHRARMLYK